MIRRVLSGILAGLFLLSAAGPAASQAKTDTKDAKEIEEVQVFQLLKCEEKETIYLAAGGGGSTVKQHNYAIAAKPVFGSEVQNVVLVEAKGGRFAQIVTGMQPGDYLTMTTEKRSNHVYVKGLAIYPLRPGEERPGVFVFVETGKQKTEGGGDVTSLKLYKLGKFATVLVPNMRDKASGKTVADPNMMQIVGKLSKGDSVEIAVAGGGATPTIKSIEPFAAPQNGVVVKLTQEEVEGGKTPAIEVTIGAGTVTVLVPGKLDPKGAWVPDGTLSSAIKPFKENDKVVVRFRTDDAGKNWLKEIARAKEPPKEPAGKT